MLLFLYRLYIFSLLPAAISGCISYETTPNFKDYNASTFSIKGVSVVAPSKPVDSTAFLAIENLNANSIAIMPYAFCSPEQPQIKYNHKGQWWGESDEGVIKSIQLAQQRNLKVMLKPHLWIGHGKYTGAFNLKTEADWKLWQDSYKEYIIHFAMIADSLKVELFCIGTELGATIRERPVFWSDLIDSVKKTFRGSITYAANWDDYKKFPFWKRLNYIGINAYFPLSDDETPEVSSLKKSWKNYSKQLEKISVSQGVPVLFTEYGYRNVDHTAEEPWKENDGNENNPAQANAFEAFYEHFSGKQWFAGGFVWKWYIDAGSPHRSNVDYTPQGKAAEKVIAKFYKN